MPLDYKIDPATQDLVKDGKGGYVKIKTAETSVQNQLLARYGECWHDPELGSKLYDLDAFKTDPATLVAEEARRALERLEAAGRIADIEVVAEQPRAGRVNVRTRFRDTSADQVVDTYVKPGG